jgi:hypothetical protein
MPRQTQFSTSRASLRDEEDDMAEAPVRDPEQQEATAERLLDVARAHPLAAFAAVLAAGYVVGRMLRR